MKVDALVQLSKNAGQSLKNLSERDDDVGRTVRDVTARAVSQTVRDILGNGSPELRKAAARIEITADAAGANQGFTETALKALQAQDVSDRAIAEAREILAGKQSARGVELPEPPARLPPQTNADVIRGTASSAQLPSVEKLVELGTGARIGLSLGVKHETVQKLADKGIVIGRPVPGGGAQLVADGVLNRGDAAAFDTANAVARILDGDAIAIEHLAERIGEVKSSADLLDISVDQWAEIGRKRGGSAVLKEDAWATLVAARVEAAHPAQALGRRLRPNGQQVNDAARIVAEAERKLDRPLFTERTLDAVDLTALDGAAETVVKAHAEVRRLDGQFPGLRVAETLENGTGTLAQRVTAVNRLTKGASTFLTRNETFLSLDLSTGSQDLEKLDFTGVSTDDRPAVLAFARGYQRLYTVAETPDLTAKLATAGYRSALSIATDGLDHLVAAKVLTDDEARHITARVETIAPGVVGMFGSILDGHRDWFDNLPFGASPTGFQKVLKDIPGYDDFFGSQDFCDCQHCRSILGPAAYFVDLMRFVDERITQPAFGTANADHPLHLKVRRPDLWTLPLTCENTNTLIPVLLIVCEVVETFIADQEGFAGPLSDRAAVARFIYRDTLPGAVDSFAQPFVLPIEEIKVFLSHDDLTPRDIAAVINPPEATRARLGLGLSDEAFTQIITPADGLGRLRTLYGVDFTQAGPLIAAFEPKLMHPNTGLTRDEVGRAIETAFVTRNGTDTIRIRGRKRSAESVQNDMEEITGLTRVALDRLRRLTLAARALGWSFDQIDVTLEALIAAGRADADLTPRTLDALVGVDALTERFRISLEDALSLVAPLPTRPVTAEGTSLTDRLFNTAPYADAAAWPDAGTTILLPAFAPAGTPVQPEVARLQAGLRLDDEGLAHLVRALAPAIGIDPEAESAPGVPDLPARSLSATLATLSTLYRHARLAKLLKIDMADLGRILGLTPGIAGAAVAGFAEITALADYVAYLKNARRSVDDVSFITGGDPSDPALYPDAADLAQQLIETVAAEEALLFPEALFTTLDDVSEATSAAIIAANGALMSAVGDAWRLTAAYAPTAVLTLPADDLDAGIEVPTAIRADASPLHALLAPLHAPNVIAARAALLLQTRPEVFATATQMLGVDLSTAAVLDSLTGVAPPNTLTTLFTETAPLCLMMSSDALTQSRLDFIRDQRIGVFDLGDPRAVSTLTLRRVDAYATWAKAADKGGVGASLDDVLLAFAPATGFATADPSALAAVLDCDVSLSDALKTVLSLPNDPFQALDAMASGVTMARRLAIGGTAFAQMASADYDTLAAGSEALQAGLRSRYETIEEWEEKVEDYRDRVLSRRRDGLVAYLVATIGGQFDTAEDLYRYFLIDGQMEGCGRTSRVVSANSTLQLYVQRVMLNLEQTPPGHARPMHVSPTLVDGEEWSWRKNYRVWEANRRVFLYPENYLLPELRDNKSELYEAFEETIASQDINADTVRDAFTTYLRGFDALSRLKISGAFHEKDSNAKRDVLHLFGVSGDDPPRHYYRRVENFQYGATEPTRATDWTPWREIDLKIPATKVSPMIHQGRLFIFWIEVSTTPRQKIEDGTSEFDGYNHRFRLLYSVRRLDGTWAEPQTLKLDKPPFHFGDGVVVDAPAYGAVHYQDDVPHPEALDGYTLSGFPWDRVYPEHTDRNRNTLTIRGLDYRVNAAVDFYEMRLGDTISSGVEDVRVPWIDPLSALFMLIFGAPIGFPSSNMLWSERTGGDRVLRKGARPAWPFFLPYATGSLFIKRENYETISDNRDGYNFMLIGTGDTAGKIIDGWTSTLTSEIGASFVGPEVIRFDDAEPDLQVINGSPNHAIIDVEGALFSLMDKAGADGKYRLARLNSSLAEDIARTLFNRGVDAMLDIETQEALAEHGLPFDVRSAQVDDDPAKVGEVDYSGPMGVYLQEIYLHLPITIAKALNAQGDFAEAREWYHKVFDPTAADEITNIPPGLSPEDEERRKLDRVWRYRRFRGRDVTSMRDILEDEAALEIYRRDPFNPHAIARTRVSAYQKYVVLAYVDNLLDEADALFATDMREQINEAVLLYVTALDILGPRPQKLGDCGERIGGGLSYEDLEDHIAGDDDMLLEIETVLINWFRRPGLFAATDVIEATLAPAYAAVDRKAIAVAVEERFEGRRFETRREIEALVREPKIATSFKFEQGVRDADYALAEAVTTPQEVAARGPFTAEAGISATRARARVASTGVGSVGKVGSAGAFRPATASDAMARAPEKARLVGRFGVRKPLGVTGAGGRDTFVPSFGWSLIRTVSPIFCIPENDALKGYWDRVEDRLFKIRNCMNIDGVRRPLALFAPRIDPLLLVRARAAGLAIDDVVGTGAGELPPYRFRFLLERARSAVGMAKAMGDAMQRALASKDAEELAQLRNTHQANILTLGTELKNLDISVAESTIEELAARRAMVQARRDHYAELIAEGDLPAETVQKVAKITGASLKIVSTGLTAASGFASLIPDPGAPTTLEWGGTQISKALRGSADTVKTLGDIAELVGLIAGMIAASERRYQGWAHQRSQADYELATLPPREAAAATRLEIAQRNLVLHETQIAQQDEIIEFYEDKFSGLALYTHLASNLQKLYRQAFNLALAYARLAETAYRFETGDDAFIIQGSYWDANRAGLLAGERLTLDLATLEQRFVEGRRRSMEVNQTFSLAQLDPAALMRVRATGGANFSIPEWAFDLFYPGQYKRRIKAVRLTIPCVAGPYTNISATLALTESHIRSIPELDQPLVAAPRARDAMIASSTAQADAGVFELNFRDDRYLPFEGSGAISAWRLDLPRTFKPFNYDSITDVLINISYTADYDAGLRDDVEDEAAALDRSLVAIFGNTDQTRVFSLRQDASAAYQRLVSSAEGTGVDFDIAEVHFPLFLRGRTLDVTATRLVLQTAPGIDGSGASFSLNGRPATGFAGDADHGGLATASVANAFPGGVLGTHTLAVTDADALAPDAGTGAMGHDKITDIFLVIEYTVSGAGP